MSLVAPNLVQPRTRPVGTWKTSLTKLSARFVLCQQLYRRTGCDAGAPLGAPLRQTQVSRILVWALLVSTHSSVPPENHSWAREEITRNLSRCELPES